MCELRRSQYSAHRGHAEFFLICLSHDNLVNHYKLNFELIYQNRFTLSELDSMLPWEREVYTNLLINRIKEENEIRKQQSGKFS